MLIILSMIACSSDQGEELRFDYYPSKTKIKHAQGFKVTYAPSYKIVDVYSNGDSTNVMQRYYLVEHGTKGPEMNKKDIAIEVPLASMGCLSTTQVAFFNNLNYTDKLSSVGHASFIQDSALQDQITKGWTLEVTQNGELNRELLLASNTDILFANGFDKASTDALSEIDIKVIYSNEYEEENVLARAEWIKFFALFFNAEKKADELFDQIEREYEGTKQRISGLKNSSNVFFGSNYQGIWYAPNAHSLIARLINDCGVNYAIEEDGSEGNKSIDLESMLQKIEEIDYMGMVMSKQGEINVNDFWKGEERLKERADAKGLNYFYVNSNTSDYFGRANVEPQVLLLDLAKVFYPDSFASHQFVYFSALSPSIEE